MSNSELTRRKLLAGLAAAGGAGAGVGTGTSALLTDEVDGLGATLAAGTLDLNVACSGDNCTETENGTVALSPTIQSGYTGDDDVEDSSELDLWLDEDSNPAYVWMRIGCIDIPDEDGDLAEKLKVTIRFNGQSIYRGSLVGISGLVKLLSPGEDNGPFYPGNDQERGYHLEITWEKTGTNDTNVSTLGGGSGDGDEYNEDLEISFPLEFKTFQRRYVNSSEFTPFDTDLSCEDSKPKEGCLESGQINMNNKSEGEFSEEFGDNEYQIKIIEARYKQPANNKFTDVKLAVYDSDDTRVPICKVHTKHEGETNTHENVDSDTWVIAPNGENRPDKHFTHMWVEICTDESGICQPTGG